MKYMLLIYQDENGVSETQRAKCYEESAQFAVQLSKSGQYLGAGPLHPPPRRPASACGTTNGW